MSFICPNVVDECLPCDESPVLNLSAESGDAPTFLGFNTEYEPPPLIGYKAFGCMGWFYSTISQEDADAQAERICSEETLVDEDDGTGSPDIPSQPPLPGDDCLPWTVIGDDMIANGNGLELGTNCGLTFYLTAGESYVQTVNGPVSIVTSDYWTTLSDFQANPPTAPYYAVPYPTGTLFDDYKVHVYLYAPPVPADIVREGLDSAAYTRVGPFALPVTIRVTLAASGTAEDTGDFFTGSYADVFARISLEQPIWPLAGTTPAYVTYAVNDSPTPQSFDYSLPAGEVVWIAVDFRFRATFGGLSNIARAAASIQGSVTTQLLAG